MQSSGDDQEEDDDSDCKYYKKTKNKKGATAYEEYLASLDPSSETSTADVSMKVCFGKEVNSRKTEDYDKKPAAKVRQEMAVFEGNLFDRVESCVKQILHCLPGMTLSRASLFQPSMQPTLKSAPTTKQHANQVTEMEGAIAKGRAMAQKSPAEKTKSNITSQKGGNNELIDQYPQAVQELVINGFELDKAIEGYKMLGDNFDDIVLFLTANMTVKELVINGFNIQKVVKAYDLIGDNMDELLAFLMSAE